MTATRQTKFRSNLTEVYQANKHKIIPELAYVTLLTTAAYTTQVVTTEAVAADYPSTWNTFNQLAQDYFVPVSGLFASTVVNGGYTVLANLASGAEWTWQQVGGDVASRTVSAFAVQAVYNGINALAGRDISEISLKERAAVDVLANGVGRSAINAVGGNALRFLGEKAPQFGGLFSKPAATTPASTLNNDESYDSLLGSNSDVEKGNRSTAPTPLRTSLTRTGLRS